MVYELGYSFISYTIYGCPFSLIFGMETLKKLVDLPSRLRWSRGSVLVFGTQVRGFKPGRIRRIFKG